MSDRAFLCASFVAVLGAVAVLAPSPGNAEPLGPDDALARAAEKNPDLATALLEAKQAAAEVVSQEERWPFVLLLDGTLSHQANPTLGATGQLFVDTADGIAAGAEVAKSWSTGTRLSLRLEGDRVTRESSFGGAIPGTVTLGPTYGVLARLSLSQPLLRGFGRDVNEAELRAARISRDAAERARLRVGSEVARDVLLGYYDLWYAQAALAIERSSRELAERQRAEAAARAEAGTLAPVEILPFQTRVASLDEAVSRAEEERLAAALALGRLLGDPSAKAESLEAASAPDPVGDLPVDVAVEAALARAPELAELEAQVALSRERAAVSGEALRSRLDLKGVLEARGLGDEELPPAFEQVGQGEAVGGLVGLEYELPFAKRGREAEAAKASLAVKAAEERLRAARERLEAEVRSRAAGLAAAAERVRLAEQTVSVARRQVEAQIERFEAGAGTSLAVREAEDALRQAELRVAQARLAQIRAALALRHLTGRLVPGA